MQPGTTVDRYTVEAELGMGGMAAVYRVRHRTLGTLHALKVLTLGRRSIRERLVQEGVLQARLAHPNIVAVTDVLDVDGAPGLLMEFVPGGSLEDLLTRQLPDLDEGERLFRGILAAVEHAHAQGVIHRDLKPANVLLADGPEGAVPKVADFGLARVLGETPGGVRATRTGMAMGTPSYMSPEQIRDAKGVDERTDVFALGCILYELVTGRVAFEGPDMLTIFNRITSGSFPPIQSLADDVPERVHAAIVGALQVDAERRLPSCAALRRVLDGTPLKTVLPPPPAGPSRPPAERPGSAPSTLVYDERREVEAPAPARRTGSGVLVLGALFGASLVLLLTAAGAFAWVLATGGLDGPGVEAPTLGITQPLPPGPGVVEPPTDPTPEQPVPEDPAPDDPPPDDPTPVEDPPAPVTDPAPPPPDDPTPDPPVRPQDPPPSPRPVVRDPAPPVVETPTPAVEDPPPPEPRPVAQDPTPEPAPTDRFKPQPVSDFPSCDRLVRCFDALAVADEPLRGMYASGIDAMLDGVKTMVRMDGVGDFSAEAQCAEMMSGYAEGFASLRQVEMYADLVPRACGF